MATTNPSQLFLLADHIKLSLLERQRAKTLKLPPQPAQDNQISRSLDTLVSGIEALERQHDGDSETDPLRPTPERDQLDQLREQYAKLESQYRGLTTITPSQPNDPSLTSDFAAATTADASNNNRRNLFPATYRDEPEEDDFVGQTDDMSNTQVHEFHQNVLARQDEQLDTLGASIGRQRELTIAIGNELDEHADLLDEVDGHMDRHQGQLDGARKRLDRFAERAKKNWGVTTIFVLIVILILLIAITK